MLNIATSENLGFTKSIKLDYKISGRFEHGCGFSHTSNSTVVSVGQSAKKEEVKVCEIPTSDGKWNHYGELTIERRARPIVTEILLGIQKFI